MFENKNGLDLFAVDIAPNFLFPASVVVSSEFEYKDTNSESNYPENSFEREFLKQKNEVINSSHHVVAVPNRPIGVMNVMNGNQWLKQASSRPIPKMLFGEFWHEGELCILFADTNLGKSILAVQIGDSISKGKAMLGLRLEAQKQKVLYCDFELSEKQFENRYSDNYTNHYTFDNDFYRAEINSEADLPEGYSIEDYIGRSLEEAIVQKGFTILIIDNLTYLRTETERAKDALPLMKELKNLKSKYNLSILALAHTPKRELSKPITKNDLQGSKMLINFCDSAFAVGECSNNKNLRYLKQIKQRATEMIYDSENVIVCNINKPFNFLQFEFCNFGRESEYLKQPTEKDIDTTIQKVQELHTQGKTQRDIALELGISLGAVNKYVRS